MRKARWLASWRNSTEKPVFYHCISRVVDKRMAFGPVEKEKFRALMRIHEKFSGCRVVAYCLMSNHFHLLLEVPPAAETGLTDKELLDRLSAIYSEAFVADVAKELLEARGRGQDATKEVREGMVARAVAEIHGRFTYRMHSLAEFMKGLLQRFTQWFNRTTERKGRLWEDRFKSVIVEDGFAARTMAAYIDLNPVRAGLVKDPAEYRWSSYGEAIGGGPKGNGKTARAGLVRALRAHKGTPADAGLWNGELAREYRKLLMENAVERSIEKVDESGEVVKQVTRKGISREERDAELARDCELTLAKTLRHRIRYFSDGAVIGSRGFVDEAFTKTRERFGPKRKDGARKPRGTGAPLAGLLWSMRDLRTNIGNTGIS